ncbi:MAG: DivIVA domain-containing protein [Bacillota bacterium]|nr:DivIVA domain-containing protein [Bacillota bacterium]MDW7728549.1 DivIVA domain-containing protein [Bacillota bacterium]
MGITPMDIQEKEFERAFRGYDMEDVDEFLDQIAKDLEELIQENSELKEKVNLLQDKNKNFMQMEETMHSAIVVAQKAADEVKHTAIKNADTIKNDALIEARKIIEDARKRSGNLIDEHESLVEQAKAFKLRFRSFLEAQLAAIDNETTFEDAAKANGFENLTRNHEPEPETVSEPEKILQIPFEPKQEQEIEAESEQPFESDLDLDYGLERDLDSDPEF